MFADGSSADPIRPTSIHMQCMLGISGLMSRHGAYLPSATHPLPSRFFSLEVTSYNINLVVILAVPYVGYNYRLTQVHHGKC